MNASFWIEAIPARKERKCKHCRFAAVYMIQHKIPTCRRHLSYEIDMHLTDKEKFESQP